MDRKKKFFLWKLILTIVSFILIILTKSNINWSDFSKNYLDYVLVKEIVYDLSVGIFSAMILIWFIDEINEHIQEKKSKEKEIEKIIRFNRILQLYIERYKLFYYCVSTPIKDRDFQNMKLSNDFKLKDMRDLHQTTTLISEGIYDTSIKSFLFAEEELKSEIQAVIKEIDFDYFPQIRECLTVFVEISLRYNQKKALLEAEQLKVGNEKSLTTEISELLENKADTFYSELQAGKQYSGGLMHPYIYLREMMKVQYDALANYEQEMKKFKI